VVCKGMEFGLYPFDKHFCYLKLTSCKCALARSCMPMTHFTQERSPNFAK